MGNSTLALCLLIYHRERNEAIGIKQDPRMVRDLGSFVRSMDKEKMREYAQTLAKATYLQALINEHVALAARVTEYITSNVDDADARNEGLHTMIKLEAHITYLGDELEALWPQ